MNGFRTILCGTLVLAALIMGIWVRVSNISGHFTHQDSIGVASSIIRSKQIDETYIRHKLSIKETDKKIFLLIKPVINSPAIFPACKYFFKVFAVPMDWTFAPLQFFLTNLFIYPHQNLSAIVFWGRLPSVLFGLVMMFIITLLIKKLYGPFWLEVSMVLLMLLACSWAGIIYSLQMYNYTLGALAALCSFYILVILENHQRSQKLNFLCGSLMGALCWAHYQMIIFSPSFFIACFIKEISPARNNFWTSLKKNMPSMLIWSIPFFGFFIFIFVFFILNRLEHSLSYGIGLNHEYLFQVPHGKSYIETMKYIICFFTKNYFLIFENFFTFNRSKTILSNLLTWLFLIIFTVGVFSFFKRKSFERLKIHILLGLSGYLFLVIRGSLAFGPSRHNYILLPFVLLFIAEGLYSVLRKVHMFKWVILLIPIWTGLLFLNGYALEVSQRQNVYLENQNKIISILNQYKADAVFDYANDQNLIYMNKIIHKFPVYNHIEDLIDRIPNAGWFGNPDLIENEPDKLAFIGSAPLGPDDLNIILTALSEKNKIKEINSFNWNQIYHEEMINTAVDMEFSDRYVIGSNSLYIYVFGTKKSI